MRATHCPFRIGDRQLDRRRGVAYAGVPLREHLEAMLRCRFDALVSWKLASITAGSCSSSAPQQSPGLRVAAALEVAESGARADACRTSATHRQRHRAWPRCRPQRPLGRHYGRFTPDAAVRAVSARLLPSDILGHARGGSRRGRRRQPSSLPLDAWRDSRGVDAVVTAFVLAPCRPSVSAPSDDRTDPSPMRNVRACDARRRAGRDSLSLPHGYHERGAVAGCVRLG